MVRVGVGGGFGMEWWWRWWLLLLLHAMRKRV